MPISPFSISTSSSVPNFHNSTLISLSRALMGNSVTRCTSCFDKPNASHNRHCRRRDQATVVSEPFCFDEGLGHSFCYVRPEPTRVSSSKVYNHEEKEKEEESTTIVVAGSGVTTFRTISGASVSANTSTPPLSDYSSSISFTTAASFDSSDSFFSVPLQPIPRFASGPFSGSIERGFLSGPIERGGFLSGPLDTKNPQSNFFRRSFSNSGPRKANLLRGLKRVIARRINLGQNSTVAPTRKEFDSADTDTTGTTSTSSSGDPSLDGEDGFDFGHSNLHWAQGKAGEDRVHVVISEDHGWVFVGIYDGFNGPDAPDYLLSSLYTAVQTELKGLLWEDNKHMNGNDTSKMTTETGKPELLMTKGNDNGSKKDRKKKKIAGVAKKWEDSQKRWKSQWDKERLELDRKLKDQLGDSQATGTVNHSEVLDALWEALKKTEQKYLDLADSMVTENPELALMGSCVLVMLMKGEDVYLMNVGDSRAVLGRKPEADVWDSIGKDRHDLERINEESVYDQNDNVDSDFDDADDGFPTLASLQLTLDHSTSIYEEVNRIRTEHPDDALAVTNDRVKGSLKVTRAFGAGFLKQPRWNNVLLEMFRIDYVGSSPYISCDPSLRHHRLTPRDRFLILSSDGLYQYLTNEEAVAEVELFMAQFPEGDPAQHLVEEVMFRAARNAGMDFHELLEIPQGDRRRYHDDVSIVVISLEGRIWRSSV